MKKFLFPFLLVAVCLCQGQSHLPAGLPQVINFTSQQYGASSQNWSLAQDAQGIIYAGNNMGLLSFDGGGWQLNELPDRQIVRSVACDNRGYIYTGGFAEFGYWEKQPYGSLRYHSLSALIKGNRFRQEEIWRILALPDAVYFQSFSSLYCYRNGKVYPIALPGNIMYLFSVNGRLYVQVLYKGIYELRANTLHLLPGTEGVLKDEIISLMPYGRDGILVGSVHNGLWLYRDNHLKPWQTPGSVFVKNAQLNAGIQTDSNNYALGTIQDGVILMDKNGNITGHLNQLNGLQNNTVLSLEKDLSGNVWVGLDKGIDLIDLHSPFRYFRDIYGKLGAIYTAALYNNRLYVGSNHGLYYLTLNGDLYTNIAGFKAVPGLEGQVWNLSVINGQLLCGHNKGTFRVEADNTVPVSTISGGWVLKPLKKHPGYLLQGTYNGLAVYTKDKSGNWLFRNILRGSEFISVRNWEEDAQGNIWVFHLYKGLYHISLSPDLQSALNVRDYSALIGKNRGNKFNFFTDGNGSLQFLSASGIYEFNLREGRFQKNTSLENRLGSGVRQVFPVPGNAAWIAQEDNHFSFYNDWQHFTGIHSYFERNFSLVSGFENIVALSDTEYLLCGENGLVLCDRRGLLQSHNNRQVYPYFSRILVANSEKYIPITGALKDTSGWQLSYRQNNLYLQAALSVYDQQVRYRFRLIGDKVPDSWSDWSLRPGKELNNLSPGYYELHVQTNLSPAEAVFSFRILNPWYWSILARIVYTLLFLAAIGLLQFLVRLKMKRQHDRLHQQMEQRLLEEKRRNEHQLLLLHQKQLEQDVQLKSEDLANSAMELIKRRKILQKLRNEIVKMKAEEKGQPALSGRIQKLSRQLDRSLKSEADDSRLFESGFNKVHEEFFSKLLKQYPQLTPQDLKLAAFLRMNLASKEIAPLLNITVRGVELKRYRLRKKIGLPMEKNLNEFMMTL